MSIPVPKTPGPQPCSKTLGRGLGLQVTIRIVQNFGIDGQTDRFTNGHPDALGSCRPVRAQRKMLLDNHLDPHSDLASSG